MLYRWREEYAQYGKDSFLGNGIIKQTPEEKELSEMKKRIRDFEMENDILKKPGHHFQEGSLIYEFIKKYCKVWRIEVMCRILRVSKSGYYSWLQCPESKRQKASIELQL